MQPNWFLAFPVQASWIEDLPPLPPRFRRFAREDVHLTLLFMGACGEESAKRALVAVREQLRLCPQRPIFVTLGSLVAMGPKRDYSALSASLDQGRDAVASLMQQLRDAPADAAGVARDSRKPLPHVTVARPQRRASEEDRRAGLAWASGVRLPGQPHVLDRVALYTWNQERTRSLFQIVDDAPLSGE